MDILTYVLAKQYTDKRANQVEGEVDNIVDNILPFKADLINGKVPSTQLPSYVSQVIEVATYNDLPNSGAEDTVYVTLDTGFSYRWTGTTYIEVSQASNYLSVPVTGMSNMGALRAYIDGINTQTPPLHCFFDFSAYIDNAYICTVLMFTQSSVNYCLIFDIINGRTFIDYAGYQDNQSVQDYVNMNQDDLLRTYKITDANTTMADISSLLGSVNEIGHHIMFDVSALNAGAYLCSIYIDQNTMKVLDLVTQRSYEAAYDGTALLTTVLGNLAGLATVNTFGFKMIAPPASNTLTEAEIENFKQGVFVKGSFIGLTNPVFMPASPTNGAGPYEYIGTVIANPVCILGIYGIKSNGLIEIYFTFASYGLGTSYRTILNATNVYVSHTFGLLGKTFPDYPTTNATPANLQIAPNGGNLIWTPVKYGPSISDNTITELTYEKISVLSLSADKTFTLKAAQTDCVPEYKALITNSGSSAITLTFTGVGTIHTNDPNIVLVAAANSTATIPAGVKVEVNIFDGDAIVYNKTANGFATTAEVEALF